MYLYKDIFVISALLFWYMQEKKPLEIAVLFTILFTVGFSNCSILKKSHLIKKINK